MVRWRCALVLAMLLLLPARTLEDDEPEEEGEEGDDDDDDDEDEEEDEGPVNKEERVTVMRTPAAHSPMKPLPVTRTIKKRPLECYVCAYKAETPLRACLDPTKYRVHTITCHGTEDRCFTTVISKGSTYEAVVRGCRSNCIGSPETTCCELNRCNSQAFAMPVIAPMELTEGSCTGKTIPPSILFFVKVLLVLQIVVKVSFI